MVKKGSPFLFLTLIFDFIEEYWEYEPLNFRGDFNAIIEVKDIFHLEDISATILSDTLWINEDDWGVFRLDAAAESTKKTVNAYVSLTKDTTQLIAEGFFNPTNLNPEKGLQVPLDESVNYFDFKVNIEGFPLSIAEYFISNNISQTEGSFSGNLQFYGLPSEPNVSGFLDVRNGATTIDFLKTRYTFDHGYIQADNYLFDASGTILKDKYGHEATLFGGVSHDRLKNLGFNANLKTNRFLAIDTKKGDNKLFYGHALGKGEVYFSGTFPQPDLYINATIGDSTLITIPITSEREASKLDFINFVEKNSKNKIEEEPGFKIKGVDLDMDLSITKEANMELVFNEQAGDVLRGNGQGNIQISVPRSGDFEMFGDYVIEEGNYLFTFYNVINKNFKVKEGGTIRWTGNPYAAQIRIEAEYKDLKASVSNFIKEYLDVVEPDLQRDANQATDVELTLKLAGELMQPNINFDINFPSLTGQLETYAESKLRTLQQDQNELNRQVFGLIVVGQFLPSDLKFQGSDIIYNTVSEFVSNQLSLLLTELFSEIITDQTILSRIDFDVAYNQYSSVNFNDEQGLNSGEEFQVQFKPYFLNDRLSILVGGNIDFGNNVNATPESTGAFIGNDLVIEYILNKDRSLKLRVYQRLKPDIGGGRRLEVGTGLSFRKEFDSFGDFLRSFRKDANKNKRREEKELNSKGN